MKGNPALVLQSLCPHLQARNDMVGEQVKAEIEALHGRKAEAMHAATQAQRRELEDICAASHMSVPTVPPAASAEAGLSGAALCAQVGARYTPLSAVDKSSASTRQHGQSFPAEAGLPGAAFCAHVELSYQLLCFAEAHCVCKPPLHGICCLVCRKHTGTESSMKAQSRTEKSLTNSCFRASSLASCTCQTFCRAATELPGRRAGGRGDGKGG